MKQNKALNVITALFASLLSILLVVVAFSAILCSTAASIVRPNTVVDFVQNIDYTSALLDNDEISELLGAQQFDSSIVNDIMNSSAVEEVISLYAKDVSSTLLGKDAVETGLTADTIIDIANKKIDEIVDIVAKSVSGDFDKDKIKQEILTAVNENAQYIADMLPPADQLLGEIDSSSLSVIHFAVGPMPTLILAGIALVLAGLIYACRYRKFGGFLWIGIDLCIAAVLTALTAIGAKVVVGMAVKGDGIGNAAIISASKVLSCNQFWGMCILLFIAILFIVGYVLLKKFVVNKKPVIAENVMVDTSEAPTEIENPAEPETEAESKEE